MNLGYIEVIPMVRCCPNCGEALEGDGYTLVLHCPNTEKDLSVEPDSNPIYCEVDE